MKEFVLVINKNNFKEKKNNTNKILNLNGFLLKPRNIAIIASLGKNKSSGFIASYDDIKDSNNIFDGEVVFEKKLYLELPPLIDDNDIKRLRDVGRGSFCFVNNNQERIYAFHDQLGNYPLYYLDNNFFSGITNNLMLLESYLLQTFNYKLERHSDALINEMIFSSPLDIGSYKDTFILPFDKEITIDNNGNTSITERRGDDYYFNSQLTKEELTYLSVKDIKENIKAIAESNFTIKISDVTGGMDSRMVLAAIVESGYKDYFFYNTNGRYPTPDANVSNYLIKKYNLKKARIIDEHNNKNNFIEEVYKFSYYSGGIKNNIDRSPLTSYRNNSIVKLGGGNSEFYKGYYSKKIFNTNDNIDIDSIVKMMTFEPFTVNDKTINDKRNQLKVMFKRWQSQGLSYESILDRFYVEYRGRYHNGTCEHWSRSTSIKVHPLYSANTIRLAFSQPAINRINGNITFDLMNALYPPLVTEPFESRTWHKDLYKESNNKDTLSKIKPITLKSRSLYFNEPPILLFKVKSSKKSSADTIVRSLINKESSWCKLQKKLGRKWHWYTLDQVQDILKKIIKHHDITYDPFITDNIKNLARKELKDFKSINEVLELHQICLHLIFKSHQETKSITNSESSVIIFEKII